MSARPDIAGARAEQRIRALRESSPDALRLAQLASLAVRVDSTLLRALRDELMPRSDAGIEADLWFSPLVESVSTQGFVFDPLVADRLRRELAAEISDDGAQVTLDRAAQIVTDEHREWPPALQLEERIIWLCLQQRASPAAESARKAEIESLLRRAAKAMGEDGTRGLEMARWAQRALRSLPAGALETEAALLLAMGAAARLGARVSLPRAGELPDSLPRSAAWIFPKRQFPEKTTVGVARHADGIEFRSADSSYPALSLPRTDPMFVEVSWHVGPVRTSQTVSLARLPAFLALSEQAADVRLRTIAGEEFRLESKASPEAPESTPDLARAVVRLERRGPHGQLSGMQTGFFVQSNLVISASHGFLAGTDEQFQVVWRDRSIACSVAGVLPERELVLLRLENDAEGCLVLPWARDNSAATSGAQWETFGFGAETSIRAQGQVSAFEMSLDIPGLSYAGGLLELSPSPALGPRNGMSGAPIVSAGQVIGMLVAAAEKGPIMAVPGKVLRQGIDDILRGQPRASTVFVIGGAKPRTSGLTFRVISALEENARVPLFDTDIAPDAPESTRLAALAEVCNTVPAAAVLATAGSRLETERSYLLIGFRKRVNEPLAVTLVSEGGRLPKSRLIEQFTQIEAASLTGPQLAARMREAYARPVPELDDAAALESIRIRLRYLLRDRPGPQADAVITSILTHGLLQLPAFANEVLATLSEEHRKEIAETAEELSFEPQAYLPLRESRYSTATRRAFSINARADAIVGALLARAWPGTVPPFQVLFAPTRENRNASVILDSLGVHVAGLLDCGSREAEWIYRSSTARFVLIFSGIPTRTFVETLLGNAPGALLLFLAGESGTPLPRELTGLVAQLGPLPPNFETRLATGRAQLEPRVERKIRPRPRETMERGRETRAAAPPPPARKKVRPMAKKKFPKKK